MNVVTASYRSYLQSHLLQEMPKKFMYTILYLM